MTTYTEVNDQITAEGKYPPSLRQARERCLDLLLLLLLFCVSFQKKDDQMVCVQGQQVSLAQSHLGTNHSMHDVSIIFSPIYLPGIKPLWSLWIKAFYTIEWSFIQKAFKFFQFPRIFN